MVLRTVKKLLKTHASFIKNNLEVKTQCPIMIKLIKMVIHQYLMANKTTNR